MPDQARRLEAARSAVFHACAVCRRVRRDLAGVGRMTKDDRSPVTVADFACQAVVARTLTERLGRVTLVAEEDSRELRSQVEAGDSNLADKVLDALRPEWPGATLADVLDAIDLGAGEPPPRGDDIHGFWTLDPIDGTKGFLRGGQYAVSLAWIENGVAVMGFLGCPNLSKDFNRPFDDPDPHGTIYFAGAGDGLYELAADDPHESPLRVRRLPSERDEPLRLCESVDGSHTSHSDAERIMGHLGELAEPSRLDGQGKYAVVARGQADAYLRLPKKSGYIERIWDHAAGAVIAMEAGLAVTDVLGLPLDFGLGRGMEKNRGIIVAEPALHGGILGVVRELSLWQEA